MKHAVMPIHRQVVGVRSREILYPTQQKTDGQAGGTIRNSEATQQAGRTAETVSQAEYGQGGSQANRQEDKQQGDKQAGGQVGRQTGTSAEMEQEKRVERRSADGQLDS